MLDVPLATQVDAIFKLDVDFAVSYDANGVAQTVCADANDDFDARLVNITLDWQDIGLPAGSNVQLTLDPSFFVRRGVALSPCTPFTMLKIMVLAGCLLGRVRGAVWVSNCSTYVFVPSSWGALCVCVFCIVQIDNGKLAGGFNVMWLIVVVVLLFVCICCCCVLCIAKCCGCCCFSDDKSA